VSFRSWPLRGAAALVLLATLSALPAAASVSAGLPGTGSWRTVPGPAVPASDSANLTALALAGPSRGWVSGFTLSNQIQNGPFEPLLAAWNGRRWRRVPVDLGSASGGRLDGLAVLSPARAWAVGTAYSATGSTSQPLTERWNGRAWTRVTAPNAPGWPYSSLLSVTARRAGQAWAVGEAAGPRGVKPLIEHWTGRRWRLAAVPAVAPDVALSGVSAAADGQAWAVGTPFLDSRHPLVLHWTGRTWQVAKTPAAGGTVLLSGVTAASARDVWAVGTVATSSGAYRAYAMRWNGRNWATIRVPAPGPAADDAQFVSVTSLGGGRLAAVGTDVGSRTGAALYGLWNGRSWTVRLGPLRRQSTELNAVAFDGQHTVWAAGSISVSDHAFVPVVQVNR
jgi:hypothetical protein